MNSVRLDVVNSIGLDVASDMIKVVEVSADKVGKNVKVLVVVVG